MEKIMKRTIDEPQFKFNESSNSTNDPVRIAVDERDLRLFLSDGFIAPPSAYPKGKIRSLEQNGKAWRLISLGTKIRVAGTAKPCVVKINHEFSSDEDTISEVLPSSAITQVFFATEKAWKDFERRNKAMSGLATSHFECTIDSDLDFVTIETVEEGDTVSLNESDVSNGASSVFDKSDRSVGAMTAIMAHENLPLNVLAIIEKMQNCDRKLVSGCLRKLCGDEDGSLSEAIEFVLDTLSNKQWSEGYSPLHMLDFLSSGLERHGLEHNEVKPWTRKSRKILENEIEANPDLMKDGKNNLLRSLLLILRTTPLSVEAVEHWSITKSSSPGECVMACSLMLAGWYEGFARQDRAKNNRALYRFASKSLAASIGENSKLNPSLDLVTDSTNIGIRTHTLSESGEAIVIKKEVADSRLIAIYWQMHKPDLDSKQLEFDFGEELDTLIVSNPEGIVQVTRRGSMIRWSASWAWSEKGRLRSWKTHQYQDIAKLAEDSSCSVYPMKFPKCGLHIDQLSSTQDDEEIDFHLKTLLDTMKKLDELCSTLWSNM
jgi:hypothetical protein